MSNRIIYWFRNDLRLHDNEGFLKATLKGAEVLPVYVVDPRMFEISALGFRKTSSFRARFLLEAIADLRQSLRARGGDLLIRIGEPERVLAELAQQYDVLELHLSKEVAQEETDVESSLSKRLKVLNVDMVFSWMATLYHVRDLPFGINKLSTEFTPFRQALEKGAKVRPTWAPAEHLTLPEEHSAGPMPTLQDLGFMESALKEPASQHTNAFTGGETAGLQALNEYLWRNTGNSHSEKTLNEIPAAKLPSRLSPWIALGCLSPRRIYEEIKHFETEQTANETTQRLISELIWRDFFHFTMLRWGTRLFKSSGLRLDKDKRWKRDQTLFDAWKQGHTGLPHIDASMHELNATGYLPHWARQNVAVFLARDLGIDWTWGAAYFESLLIDYQVSSNWGNWNYGAGVGNDSHFKPVIKAAHPEYIRQWLPELAAVPDEKIPAVWRLSPEEQNLYGVQLEKDYPLPIIPADPWLEGVGSH